MRRSIAKAASGAINNTIRVEIYNESENATHNAILDANTRIRRITLAMIRMIRIPISNVTLGAVHDASENAIQRLLRCDEV